MSATAHGDEEMSFSLNAMNALLRDGDAVDIVSDLRQKEFEDEEAVLDEETAEGEESAEDGGELNLNFQFREGNSVDVISGLREREFINRTQDYQEEEEFKSEDENRLNTDNQGTSPTQMFTPNNPSIITPPTNGPIGDKEFTPQPEVSQPEPKPQPQPEPTPPAQPNVNISINDITVNEATGTATLTVTLSKASSGAVTVDYATAYGTATSGDYTSTNATLTFAAGETSKTIEVPITNDDIYEVSETLYVNLSNPTGGATIAKDQGTITIKDDGTGTVEGENMLDNDQPTMTIADTVTEEGSNAVFDVTLSNEAKEPYKVTFNTTVNGSAEADDITSPIIVKDSNGNEITANGDGSYTVPAGETSLTVEVPTVDDNVYEGDETFELNGKTEFMDNDTSGTGTIKDDGNATDGNDADNEADDDRPIVSIVATDDNAVEGTTNNTLVFAVTQTNVSDFDTTVDINLNLDETEVANITSISYTDANGNAVNLNDATAITNFVTNGGTVKIAAGQTTSPQITLTVADDNEYEVSESLNMSITNPVNAVLGTTSASATIYDEDSNDPSETNPDNIDKEGDKPISAKIGNPSDVNVDEDDLSSGSSPDASALTKTGSLDVSVGTESFDTVFNYSDGTDSGLTSHGATVYYYLDESGHTLTASTANNEADVAENNTVFTATLTNPTVANAGYSFTLKGNIDHPTANGENTQEVDLDVKLMENGSSVDTDSFSVTITDDVPSSTGVNDELHIGPQVTNLVFTIDVSGSMAWAFDGSKDGSQERLNAAKDSAKALIAEYEKLGEVNVMVTTFGGSTMSTLGSGVWMDGDEARSEINGMSASGGTQYNSAMDHTAQTYMDSTIPQSNATVVYFISDGEPNSGYGPHQATLWDDFVNRDEITSVDAVGVSNALGLMNLQIVAGINPAGEANYDNTSNTTTVNANHLGLNVDGDAYVFSDAASMQAKFIENATVSESGNVINDTVNDTIYIVGGADDAYVQSIKIGSTTYTFDGTSISDGSTTIGSGSVMEVATTLQKDGSTPIGSKIKFDFATGEYTYTINSTLGGVQYNESFDVVVVDNDGDTVEKTLSFDVNTNAAPVAQDDTNSVDEDATLTVAAGEGVLNNDSDVNSDPLEVSQIRTGEENGNGTQGTVGEELIGTYGTLTLNDDGSYTYVANQPAADALNDGETAVDTFTYTVSDGNGGSDTAQLSITVNGQDEIVPPSLKMSAAHNIKFFVPDTVEVVDGKLEITTNLVVTLDISGSMGTERLNLAKNSLEALINQYKAEGTTKVNLTTFSSDADNHGWMDADTAIATINSLSSNGWTNYEAAIKETTQNVDFSGHEASRTLAFFVSDGDPTREIKSDGSLSSTSTSNVMSSLDGTGTSTKGVTIDGVTYGRVDKEYYDMWKDFTTNQTNGVETTTIGLGDGLSDEGEAYLNMMADAYGGSALFVEDSVAQLTAALSPEETIEGNVFDFVQQGTSNISIDAITIGGQEFNQSLTNQAIDGKGKFSIDFDTGAYSYTIKKSEFSEDTVQSFGVKVSDENANELDFNVDMHVFTFHPTITGDAGDNEITYNPTAIIDGGDGDDTLVLLAEQGIDFSDEVLDVATISNIETIDMNNDSANALTNLTLQDVVDMTDSDNEIIIKGDSNDSVDFDTSGWSQTNSGNENNGTKTYTYSDGGDKTVTLTVDDDLTTNL